LRALGVDVRCTPTVGAAEFHRRGVTADDFLERRTWWPERMAVWRRSRSARPTRTELATHGGPMEDGGVAGFVARRGSTTRRVGALLDKPFMSRQCLPTGRPCNIGRPGRPGAQCRARAHAPAGACTGGYWIEEDTILGHCDGPLSTSPHAGGLTRGKRSRCTGAPSALPRGRAFSRLCRACSALATAGAASGSSWPGSFAIDQCTPLRFGVAHSRTRRPEPTRTTPCRPPKPAVMTLTEDRRGSGGRGRSRGCGLQDRAS